MQASVITNSRLVVRLLFLLSFLKKYTKVENISSDMAPVVATAIVERAATLVVSESSNLSILDGRLLSFRFCWQYLAAQAEKDLIAEQSQVLLI